MQIKHGKSTEEFKKDTVELIKEQAFTTIEEKYPLWKQINLNSRAIEILALGNKASSDEQKELLSIQKVITWINKVRTVTNIAEENVAKETTIINIRKCKDDTIKEIKDKIKDLED